MDYELWVQADLGENATRMKGISGLILLVIPLAACLFVWLLHEDN